MIFQIVGEDLQRARKQVVEWGYPREPSDNELLGFWMQYHSYCIVWFNALPETDDSWWSFHVSADPNRGDVEIGSEKNRFLLGVIAQLLGAARLYSVAPGLDPRINRERLIKYHEPHGWKVDELGVYIDFTEETED